MLAWLLRKLWQFLEMLGIVSSAPALEDESGTAVTVKAVPDGVPVRLVLQPNHTIREVKAQLLEELGHSVEDGAPEQDVRIILAGRELGDTVSVASCDLGSQSILHAVRVETSPRQKGREIFPPIGGGDPLCQNLVDLQLTGTERRNVEVSQQPEKVAHFYTWCPDSLSLEAAKLRVRCSSCSEGCILLHSDPCSWQDVLNPNQILGYCEMCCTDYPVVFYFRCGNMSHHHPPFEVVTPLELVKRNLGGVPCLACTEPSCPLVLVFPCLAQHVICLECFSQYSRSRLNDRQFLLSPTHGYSLGCPVLCEDSLINQPLHFRLMGHEAWDKYLRFSAEELVIQGGGVLCPQPGCGAGIMQEQEDRMECNRVACRECGYVFCRDCLQGAHLGPCGPCNDDLGGDTGPTSLSELHLSPADPRVVLARWQGADPSSVTIRTISKPCPGCRTPTERSGGCMHMICTKAGCGLHWCWVCQVEWTRDCMASHWFG